MFLEVACVNVLGKEGWECLSARVRITAFMGVFVGMCVYLCVSWMHKRKIYLKKKTLSEEVPSEKSETESKFWMKHGYSVMFLVFLNLGGCPQCPCLLLYVLYQNITIECWPACLYPSNKGDFLSVSVIFLSWTTVIILPSSIYPRLLLYFKRLTCLSLHQIHIS